MPVGALSDSRLVVVERFFTTFVAARGVVVRDSTWLLLYQPDTGQADSIAHLPRADIIVGAESMMRTAAMPFSPALRVAVDPRGETVYWGFSDAFRVFRWRVGGVPEIFLDLAAPARPIGPGTVQKHLADRPEVARIASGAEPRFLPFFDRLVVAADREVWVREYQVDASAPSRWAVFDSLGALVREVRLPARFTLGAARHPEVYGVQEDASGDQVVRSYILRRESSLAMP